MSSSAYPSLEAIPVTLDAITTFIASLGILDLQEVFVGTTVGTIFILLILSSLMPSGGDVIKSLRVSYFPVWAWIGSASLLALSLTTAPVLLGTILLPLTLSTAVALGVAIIAAAWTAAATLRLPPDTATPAAEMEPGGKFARLVDGYSRQALLAVLYREKLGPAGNRLFLSTAIVAGLTCVYGNIFHSALALVLALVLLLLPFGLTVQRIARVGNWRLLRQRRALRDRGLDAAQNRHPFDRFIDPDVDRALKAAKTLPAALLPRRDHKGRKVAALPGAL